MAKRKIPLQQRAPAESGIIYFLGVIGAAVYYIQHATGFWMGVLGILKALVWPAMLVYKLLGL
jgi:hypothetical protein